MADAELLRTACDQLTGVVQQAFRLKLAGYPVTSSDPTITTIVGLLGKCERTIRNYLQQAAAILAAWWTREQTALAQDLIPPEPVIAPTASLGVVAAAPVPTLEAPPLPAPPPAPCPRPPRRPWTPRLPQWVGTLVGGLAALGTRLHRKLIAVGRQWVATSPALRATPPALGGSARAAPPGAGAAQYQGHQGSPLERAGPRGRPGAVPLGESCCAVRGSPPAAAHQPRAGCAARIYSFSGRDLARIPAPPRKGSHGYLDSTRRHPHAPDTRRWAVLHPRRTPSRGRGLY